MRPRNLAALALVFALLIVVSASAAEDKPAPVVKPGQPYRPAEELKGKLRIVGSRTLAHAAAHWSEGFRRHHPKVEVEIQAEGSETATPEPAPAVETLWAVSREMTQAEVEGLQAGGEQKIYPVGVCDDLVGIVVHKDNPVTSLTLAQLGRLLREKPKGEKATWADVGLRGDWADEAVLPQGRDGTSGTRTYLRQLLVGKDGKEAAVKEHASFKAMFEEIGKQRGAVGYCRWLGQGDGYKFVPLRATADDDAVAPSRDPQAAAKYPLKRRLQLVAATPADAKLSALRRDFLLYVLSRNGQEDAVKDGFIAMDRAGVLEGLDRLGLNPIK